MLSINYFQTAGKYETFRTCLSINWFQLKGNFQTKSPPPGTVPHPDILYSFNYFQTAGKYEKVRPKF